MLFYFTLVCGLIVAYPWARYTFERVDGAPPTLCFSSPQVRVWCSVGNSFGTITYLYEDTATSKAAFVDATGGASSWKRFVVDRDLEVEAILLTHAHFDHIYSVADWPDVPVFLHGLDMPHFRLRGMPLKKSTGRTAPVVALGMAIALKTVRRRSGPPPSPLPNEVRVGTRTLRVFHAPGHSPGSCVFFDDRVAFTGDFVFRGARGRTDLGGGSPHALRESLRRFDDVVTPRTIVFPGHGSRTTWGEERESCTA